jgi:predicted RNA binding protein YcfA (HicA-like mRNA interferase family)
MSQHDKILLKILSGLSDADISFLELCNVLKYLGFKERINGSHHIFYKDGIKEIINLQPKCHSAHQVYQACCSTFVPPKTIVSIIS